MTKITFKELSEENISYVYNWMKKPHIQEIWDEPFDIFKTTEQEFIKLYIEEEENTNWIVYANNIPFALVNIHDIEEGNEYAEWKVGTTKLLGVLIGEESFLRKGLLKCIFNSVIEQKCSKIDTLIINPSEDNLNAIRAFKNFGFEIAGSYIVKDSKKLLINPDKENKKKIVECTYSIYIEKLIGKKYIILRLFIKNFKKN